MATRKLEIIIDANGKSAIKEMDKVSKKAEKTGINIGSAIKKGALIGAAAVGTLVFAMSKAVAAANEQEAAEKSLEVALGGTSQALLDQASALQKVTAFGDETIIKAQALIAAFVKDEDQIKAATAATLDLAAAKGFDLVTAADLVSKTLGSSTNALSRYGIEVKGAVGSTERLASLTGNLEKVFGGQARGQVETFGGATTQLSNAFGDLLENIGFFITKNPVIIGAVQDITKVFGELAASMAVSGERDVFDLHTDRINQLNGNLKALQETQARGLDVSRQIADTQRQIAEENLQFKDGILATAAAHKAEEEAIISKAEAQITAAQMTVPATREELTGDLEAQDEFSKLARQAELDQLRLMALADLQAQELAMAIEHGASITEVSRIVNEQQQEFDKTTSDARLRNAASTAGSLANLAQNLNTALGGQSKKAFKAMQGFAIAEALINTWQGATKALAQGGIFGFAGAAAVIASGLAQVQNIRSQQPSGGGGGGSISAGGATLPTRTGGGASAQGIPVRIEEDKATPTQEINITFQADGIIAKDTLSQMKEDLIATINEGGTENLLINANVIAT